MKQSTDQITQQSTRDAFFLIRDQESHFQFFDGDKFKDRLSEICQRNGADLKSLIKSYLEDHETAYIAIETELEQNFKLGAIRTTELLKSWLHG